jgi:hypothetical protein
MKTILVQINNTSAYKLLQDLEELNLIKILDAADEPKQKLSEKYAGKLPADIADEMQMYLIKGRQE